MKQAELRGELRISVTRRGSLTSGEERFPCVVQDMSDSGFLLMCPRALEVGQDLDFRCELFPGQVLECRIQVMHVSEAGVGTKITEIDKRGIRLCQLFLQEHYSHRQTRWL